MTVPIGAIAAISPFTTTIDATQAVTNTVPAAGSSATNFASALAHGLDAVSATQANADTLAVQAATGQLADPAQYTIAATQASLMTQLATTIENKAVTAFNTVMGMQA